VNEIHTENIVAATWNGPLSPPASIPREADVVIIGGGIVGVSTAWFLARQGVDVVLCEKGHIAGEQSGRNWGWVRQQGRDIREMPMMIESMRIFRNLENDIGADVGFVEGGCMLTAKTDGDLEKFDQWISMAREFDLDTRILGASEIGDLVAGATMKWRGAMYTASDARAEPHKTTTAIARAAVKAGATILPSCAVRGLDLAGGRVAGVVTEHGTIRSTTVLCAAGAWTSMFCRSLGIDVPQLKVRGTVARTAPAEKVLDGSLFSKVLGIRRRDDGGYTVGHGAILDHGITPSTFRYAFKFIPALMKEITVLRLRFGQDFVDEFSMPKQWALDKPSPFESNRVLDPAPNPKIVARIEKSLGMVFPALAGTAIVETWAGIVETVPDVVPVIDESDEIPGFHIATGFSGHGFGIGPGAGKALAAMLTGSDHSIDLEPFRLGRFFDGSPIDVQSSI